MLEIRDTLNADWDPIDVMGDPDMPRDEYEGYVGPLYTFLARGESAEFIARHLCFLEDRMMGLGGADPANRLEVAMKLKSIDLGIARDAES